MAKRTSRRIDRSQAGKSKQKRPPLWVLAVAVVAIVAVVVVVAVSAGQSETAAVTTQEYKSMPPDWIDGTTLGNPEAPVTVQLWEDFICPACAQWTQQIEPQFMQDYIVPGTVRVEFHHLPLSQHEPAASLAAQASECAADQNAFWPYHDQLFPLASNRGASAVTLDALQEIAQNLGLDSGEFSRCMNSQKHWDKVRESVNQAISLKLTSTPSIVINGKVVEQPFDYQALSSEIERLANAASQ